MDDLRLLRKIIMFFTLIFLIFVNYTVITGRRDLTVSRNRELMSELNRIIKKELPGEKKDEREDLKIKNDSEYIYINLLELGNMIIKNRKFSEENKFCVRGMVYNDRKLKKDKQFGLVRLMIWCCVADATPAGAVIQNNSEIELENKQWIKVYGRVELDEKKLVNCKWALIPDEIIKIKPPQNEYIFNAKEKKPFEY